MFGKGTFKSSGNFRPSISNVTEEKSLNEKISAFTEAEISEKSGDINKAVQLYSKFLNESENADEGNSIFKIQNSI